MMSRSHLLSGYRLFPLTFAARAFGQRWNVQVLVVPVIPKLIKGSLFD